MNNSSDMDQLSLIEQMAELNITGSGMSDYQKTKALDILCNSVKSSKKGELKDAFADAQNQIRNFLQKDAEKGNWKFGSRKIEELEKFVDLFYTLMQEQYDGDPRLLYKNRLRIRSAYLWYIDAMIRRKSDLKKQKQNGGNK